MQTSLSLPHTLALCASFTLHPTAISASSLHFSFLHSLAFTFLFSTLTIFLLPPYFLFSRFSIDPQSDPEALFRITPDTGLITTAMQLDREREHWHNITVIATQRGQRSLFVHHFTLSYHKSLSVGSFLLFIAKTIQLNQHFTTTDTCTH